jgi:hypothetical protein
MNKAFHLKLIKNKKYHFPFTIIKRECKLAYAPANSFIDTLSFSIEETHFFSKARSGWREVRMKDERARLLDRREKESED